MKFKLHLFLLILSTNAFSQVESEELRAKLNEDGSHYFKITFLNQTWIRFNQSNPGTTVSGQSSENTFDIGLRRTRSQLYGQITDRAFLYFQFGLNNFNRMTGINSNRKNVAFFHDAVAEYRLSKENQLKLGAGLTIANGLSRFSQPSIGTILALDVPVFAQATVDQTDLFSRKLSIYARGQIGKWDYRFSLSDPFPVSSSGSTPPAISYTNSSFAVKGHKFQQQGYIMYQFFEKEGHTTPYMPGTYLGKKKILNLGGGLIFQKNAMWLKDDLYPDSTKYEDMLLWSLESFFETPLNKTTGTALTAYLGYFNYNYGTNYVRTQAQMNPADPNSTDLQVNQYSKGGNGWPMFGTGNIIFAQAGYLFRKDLLGNLGTIQPYLCVQRNDLTALGREFYVFNTGINWLLNGHKSKLSLDMQNRPVFSGTSVISRRNCFIIQYQVSI
jgi:hypothetical protein